MKCFSSVTKPLIKICSSRMLRPGCFSLLICNQKAGASSEVGIMLQIECLPTCVGDGAKFEGVTCHEYLNSKYKATHSRFTHAAAA